ncbi:MULTISPECIES: hypothetical protein [unclassified Streptomyces]|uniref:hypothetical protein n=1 Tax=unclassified Streptomyces TaxID=2593676 RepID=UPI00386EF8EE|nr:hypothetical protein OG569_24725 [Streptomyces sp. NBC_00827]
MSAAPASAASYTMYCDTTGASGASTINGWAVGATSLGVILSVTDGSADGHHVRIRLLGKDRAGNLITYQWRMNYDGNGTTKTWTTTASYSAGFGDVGVQVARFEGDTQLNACTDWLRGSEG